MHTKKKRNIWSGVIALNLLFGQASLAQESVHLKNYAKLFPNPEWSFYANPIWEYWDEWQPGGKYAPGHFTEDDNFFIARTKLQPRLYNENTQVNQELQAKNGRQVFWWMPISNGDKTMMGHPRAEMHADNFNMWQYINVHGNWNQEFFRVDGALGDVAFRNGVKTGALMFMDRAEGEGIIDFENPKNKHARILQTLMRKNEKGEFTEVAKLIKLLKYYGISGLTINPEADLTENTSRTLQDFLLACRKEANKQGWGHQWYVAWYDGLTDEGEHDFAYNALTKDRLDWFRGRENPKDTIVDLFFINYNHFEGQLKHSELMAEKHGRNTYDVYVGQHVGGRGYGTNWVNIEKYKLSIGLWGEHNSNHIFAEAKGKTEYDRAVDYISKQEMFFSGGAKDPANTPQTWPAGYTPITNESLNSFPGMAKLVVANSTLTQLPFITYFNLGNGSKYYVDGHISNPIAWYNIGVQDHLPTWRWWITDDHKQDAKQPVNCQLTFEDAYQGGSSLKISGETDYSHIHLYKTAFEIPAYAKASLTYKVNNVTDAKLKLAYSLVGSESDFIYVDIPMTSKIKSWVHHDFDMAQLGLNKGDVIATLGLIVKNSKAEDEILIGKMELSATASYKPLKPKLRSKVTTYTEGLDHNQVSCKVIWDSKVSKDPWQVIYNEDVDTWYFEILVKDNRGTRVVNTTTSWAAMTVAEIDKNSPKVRVGVRAVAPDGKTRSAIAWTTLKL